MERDIISVYPSDRGLTVRPDLNRCITPRESTYQDPARILWTSTRNEDMTVLQWIPNHFVLLMAVALIRSISSVHILPDVVETMPGIHSEPILDLDEVDEVDVVYWNVDGVDVSLPNAVLYTIS
jgi:hypothetical protein